MAEFAENLGIETLRMADGECEVALDLSEFHMSMASRAHGGVLFTLLDMALGRAVLSQLPEGRGCATLEAAIHYFRPVQRGRIRAVGKVMRVTRHTAYAEGKLTDAEDNVLASATGTFFLTETLKQADRERI
ncbi:MAG: PaaI family thioesterase [Deltaproteobacteria bacterium]|nr:PaaI family thioesterase [Deltaproteobacteria bacterium]